MKVNCNHVCAEFFNCKFCPCCWVADDVFNVHFDGFAQGDFHVENV